MKRVLSCLLAVMLCMCSAATAFAVSDGDVASASDVPAISVQSTDLIERLYGGDTDDITDPGLTEFLNGYTGNKVTTSMRFDYSYVEHYDVDMTITDERKVSITETIDVMFNEESHGYYRYIPFYGAEEMYRVTNVEAYGAEVLITESDEEISIRMGSEDITVVGPMTYVFKYDIEYFNDITSGGDRIYQDIFADHLEDHILNATARIHLPEGAELLDWITYSGSYGSRDNSMEAYVCDGTMYLYAEDSFEPYSGATIELLFPDGTFTNRPADITVSSAQIDLTVAEDGTYILRQDLTADVYEDASSPILPVWQHIALLDKLNSSDPGTSAANVTISVDDQQYLSGRVPYDYCCPVKLSSSKGQTVTVTSVQKGRFDVTDGNFELDGVIIPISYLRGNMTEYKNVTFTAHLPSVEGKEFVCTKGASTGSESDNYYFDIEDTGDGFVATLRGTLPVGEKAMISFGLPEGAVKRPMTWTDWLLSILPLGLGGAITALRFRKKRAFVPTMEYYAPDDLNPAEVGFIIDGKADAQDLTSLIYYWAAHGHLSIEMTGKTTYTLHKLSDLDAAHRGYERVMFRKLWVLGGNDGDVRSSQLNEKFFSTLATATVQLKKQYSSKGTSLSDTARDRICRISALAVIALAALLPFALSVIAPARTGRESIAVTAALLFWLPAYWIMSWKGGTVYEKRSFFNRTMCNIAALALGAIGSLLYWLMLAPVAVGIIPAALFAIAVPVVLCLLPGTRDRSEYGSYIIARCVGFKNFLETAEKSRLEMLLEENPEYY